MRNSKLRGTMLRFNHNLFSKRLMKFPYAILLLFLSLLVGCSSDTGKNAGKEPAPVSKTKLKIGLVFDVGGRGDKSFNDSAYNGLEMAKQKHGVTNLYIEPQGEGADREAALRQMATDPEIGLIIGVGLLFSDDITTVAAEFPDKKFADLYVKTARAKNNTAMRVTYNRLIKHIFYKMGEFQIDGWNLKTPIDVE